MNVLLRAWNFQVIYIVGKEQLKIALSKNIFRQTVLWAILWMRGSSRTKIQQMKVESDRLVEVDLVKEM